MNKQEDTRWIKFLGGRNTFYTLLLICLSAVTVLLLQQISFIFRPIAVILSVVLPPVVLALVLYYLFNPLVSYLHTKRWPRSLSIAAIFALILFLLVIGGMQLFPMLQRQLQDLLSQLPKLITDFEEQAYTLVSKTPFAPQIDQMFDSVDELTRKATNFLAAYWQTGAKQLGSVFSVVSATLFTLFTGPLVAFFLLKDPQKFYQAVLRIVPPAFRKDFRALVSIADEQLSAFLKGQIIASFLLGLIYWLAFILIGMKFASILAIAAGILCIAPYIGPFIAFFPGLFVAAQMSGWMAVKFVIVWFVVQLLHGDLVVPRVMGNRLKIHPITILFVLLIMGNLLGFIGVILGIPIYSLIKLIIVYIFRKFKHRYNQFYGSEGHYEKTDLTKENYLE